MIFFGFAAVLAIVGGLRVTERFRKTRPSRRENASNRNVLAGCVREIHGVRAEALRDGWTSNLAVRALAPFRVAGAIVLQQPIAQTLVAGDTPSREGQLALRHGMLRRRYALVSASITADAIDRLRTSGNGGPPIDTTVLDRIREALVALTAVRYGRLRDIDVEDLDRTLDNGCSALQQLRMTRLAAARGRCVAEMGAGWMAPLTDLLIVVRRTLGELMRVRWNDLHFAAVETALLMLAVLAATALFMGAVRGIRAPRERRAAVGVPAVLSVMRRSPFSGFAMHRLRCSCLASRFSPLRLPTRSRASRASR